jgi:hypothetical protein
MAYRYVRLSQIISILVGKIVARSKVRRYHRHDSKGTSDLEMGIFLVVIHLYEMAKKSNNANTGQTSELGQSAETAPTQ